MPVTALSGDDADTALLEAHVRIREAEDLTLAEAPVDHDRHDRDRRQHHLRLQLVQAEPQRGRPGVASRAASAITLEDMRLSLALLGALAAEQCDSTFHRVEDLREFTRLPVLVAISAITPGHGRRALRLALATASVLAVIAIVAALVCEIK